MKRFYIKLILILALCIPGYALAQTFRSHVTMFELRAYHNDGNPGIFLGNALSKEELMQRYEGPEEPLIPKIDFYAFDQPGHISGQAESLVHGIVIALPPEYDHYGYELRRFMRSVGNYEIYKRKSEVEIQLRNVERAGIVYKHWRQKLLSDIQKLEQRVETENADSKSRTTLKVNASLVKTFIIELQSWLNANESLLEFLSARHRYLRFEGNTLYFQAPQDKAKFMSLYAARENARKQIKEYDPFKIMVF